ncbi:aaa family ATPase [Niveomyces insectorum RCEF 264]|uniref:Iron-sulfur assembly protein 1 n=1 Tax=Niveomyces insectorum RCEF 264 TaxID=1081102 RepID=A0A167P0X1_9HYPO|nr:aaa family ATPase [Niveomyces insectorum RCEF 264]
MNTAVSLPRATSVCLFCRQSLRQIRQQQHQLSGSVEFAPMYKTLIASQRRRFLSGTAVTRLPSFASAAAAAAAAPAPHVAHSTTASSTTTPSTDGARNKKASITATTSPYTRYSLYPDPAPPMTMRPPPPPPPAESMEFSETTKPAQVQQAQTAASTPPTGRTESEKRALAEADPGPAVAGAATTADAAQAAAATVPGMAKSTPPKPKRPSRLRTPRKAPMRLTSAAVERVRELLDSPTPQLLKVGVRNRGCSGLAYHLEYVEKPGSFDELVEQDGVQVLVDSKALFSIIGSEMDWVEDKLNQRFVFRNPNIKEECGCGNGSIMFSRPASTSTPLSQAFSAAATIVDCPICSKHVRSADINAHLDAGCATHVVDAASSSSLNGTANGATNGGTISSTNRPTPTTPLPSSPPPTQTNGLAASQKRSSSTFFQTPASKRQQQSRNSTSEDAVGSHIATPRVATATYTVPISPSQPPPPPPPPQPQQQQQPELAKNGAGIKRGFDEGPGQGSPTNGDTEGRRSQTHAQVAATTASASGAVAGAGAGGGGPTAKRARTLRAAPLAERMRPQSLDDVCGQDLVGPNGLLRALIDADRVPSMILWGGSGTGKTTIARCIAQRVGSRFVELNATSSGGVAECKKLFQDAAHELALTGRKTILFCDEIHRFSKAQQDVFLKPVEAGTVTLIGATTENPSFRVGSALLSRCRTFTLAPLTKEDVQRILVRAVQEETGVAVGTPADAAPTDTAPEGDESSAATGTRTLSPLIDEELLGYLAAFADGDARTALNLLELAMSLAAQPKAVTGPAAAESAPLTKEDLKAALTKTLVYDRAGDQHYDSISALHKAVRGSDPDATLYYLARMLQSGEDPLFIARRLVVIASEDVGLADSTLLPLATAAYTATQQLGMPEARIPLAHCAVALALAPKSTRAYRGLNNAFAALREPGVAALPIPLHLRNAPTRLMKDLGYGAAYKYNPNYLNGRVQQTYLPEPLLGRTFLEARDLGTAVDPELED